MTLINEILDLAKIEAGTMAVEIGAVRFANLRDYVDQTFRQVAEEKGLSFSVELDDGLPRSIETDDMRLAAGAARICSRTRSSSRSDGGVKLSIGTAGPLGRLRNDAHARPRSSRSPSPIPASASPTTSSG